MQPNASVIVCTRNRWPLLAGCLSSLAQQTLDDLEIIVVDNGSTDATSEQLESWRRAGRRRLVVTEPIAGLSRARNCGLESATGDVVLFLDDDAIAPPAWAFSHLVAYRREEVVGVGGPILLTFPDGRPEWAVPELEHWWSALHLGDEPRSFSPLQSPYGANMSIRKTVALHSGGFSLSLGRVGASLLSSEEADLFDSVRAVGILHYEPAAVVVHKVTAERLRARWLLRRGLAQGRTNARRDGVLEGRHLRSRCIAHAKEAIRDLPSPSWRWIRDPRAHGNVLNDLCRRAGHLAWACEHLHQSMRAVGRGSSAIPRTARHVEAPE